MSRMFTLMLIFSLASIVAADLRMASWPKTGYDLRDQGTVTWNTAEGSGQFHEYYLEPSTFGYGGLFRQKYRNYDNFLRSNIDNEQDNRHFEDEDGKDHLPFRTLDTTAPPFYKRPPDQGRRRRGGVQQIEEELIQYTTPGESTLVPLRWNNPHSAEMEINIWIFQTGSTQPVVVPIRKPSCSGEGYQDNIVSFTVPSDFSKLGEKIPGFKGCNPDTRPMCTLQLYSHSVESRQYAIGFPIVVRGHNASLTTQTFEQIQKASEDPWLEIDDLRDICLPATDPSATIATSVPRWARLVSDVYTHSYMNSDYSPYSGQQQESISKNLQASAINKMEVGNRGELGKAILPEETRNRLNQLRRMEDRIYKNYEQLANKIINSLGNQMTNSGNIGVQDLANCFRCAESGSTNTNRLQTNTYIPSFQLPENLQKQARSLVPDKYKELITQSGLVQIYVASMNDLLPFFYKSRYLGILYQPAELKNTLSTKADSTNFTKRNADGLKDGGSYASAEAKKAWAESHGCPSDCLYGLQPQNLTEQASAVPIFAYYHRHGDQEYTTHSTPDPFDDQWNSIGIAFYAYRAKVNGTVPIYEYYNPRSRDHEYTTRSTPFSNDWRSRGIAFYAYGKQVNGTVPIYGYYHNRASYREYTTRSTPSSDNEWTRLGLVFYAEVTTAPKAEFKLNSNGCTDGEVIAANSSLQELPSISAGNWFTPLVRYQGADYPICGHYFWDNDDGATAVCKKLGFDSGVRKVTREQYSNHAMQVGRCSAGQKNLISCNAGGNSWGSFHRHCTAGNSIGVKVQCFGGSFVFMKTTSCPGSNAANTQAAYLKQIGFSCRNARRQHPGGIRQGTTPAACKSVCDADSSCTGYDTYSHGGVGPGFAKWCVICTGNWTLTSQQYWHHYDKQVDNLNAAAAEDEEVECQEPQARHHDAGFGDSYRGWFDVQGCGRCNDYCRWVGRSGSGGDPSEKLVHGGSWWSCRLAGQQDPYSPKGYFSAWNFSRCAGMGALAPEFMVKIEKNEDGNLGMDMVPRDKKTLKIQRIDEGPVTAWNAANPDWQLKEGYVVLEINGVRGNAENLTNASKEGQELQIVVRRRDFAKPLIDGSRATGISSACAPCEQFFGSGTAPLNKKVAVNGILPKVAEPSVSPLATEIASGGLPGGMAKLQDNPEEGNIYQPGNSPELTTDF